MSHHAIRSETLRVAVVAPSCRITPEVGERVRALAAAHFPEVELHYHPQCYLSDGHFAGPDQARADAFVEAANDPSFDALWFARGGYGSNRALEGVLPRLGDAARAKSYIGYSDAGFMLGALYAASIGQPVHGPMPGDINRAGGDAAVLRSLAWLARRDPNALEPSLTDGRPAVALNLTILSHLLGTPWAPDLAGHVLMLEEIGEYMYRIDRALFHVTADPGIRQVAGLRLGRCSDIPENDPDFVRTEEQIAEEWCVRHGIAWLGRADIGHDIDNKVVPFGGAIR